MKKWLMAFTASAVLIGCGGGSGLSGTSGGSGGSGGGGRTVPTVNLGSKAQAQILYLSGQGRRAPGSQIAVLDNIRVFNSPTDYAPPDQIGSGSPIRIQLDGYTLNQFVFDVPLTVGGPGKTYTQFPLEIRQIDEEDAGGGWGVVYSGPPYLVSPFFKLNMQLFPGRQSTMQVTLNDAMLRFDPSLGVVFDRAQFETENYNPADGKINSFLSDMITFDVAALPPAQRPLLQNGQRADLVHFSGDSIGISGPFAVVSGKEVASFDMLNPVVIDSGTLTKPEVIGGRQAPGVYTVNEPDPTDPFGNATLVALMGTYRHHTEVLSNLSDFAMVAFPTTRSANSLQVVLFNRDANGTITAMWQGVINVTGATKGLLRLFSLDQLPDAGASPLATGEVSLVKVNGIVKEGTFVVRTAPTTFAFPKSGGFVVLR